jgi:hypothetical protein
MKYLKNSLILPLVFIVGHSLSTNVYSQGPQVIVKINPEYRETSYTVITDDSQEISLTTYQTEINKGILHLRSKSDLPFNKQIDLLSKILKRVLKELNKEEIHTLFIGRLIHAFGKNNTEMSERLALSAYKSPLWDNKKGKPFSAHENTVVETIANKGRIFPELSRIFAGHGLVIKVSGVEKVRISQPDMTPFGESLKSKGVRNTAKIPYDCLVWFSVSKARNRIYLGGGYWKDENGVYWKWREIKDTSIYDKPEEIKFIEKEVEGADPDTFHFLAERVEGVWGKDSNGIYFFHEKIEGVDVDTWIPYDWGYSKDKNSVYDGSRRLQGTDPQTFKIPVGR